jgi:hypothetical protein
MPFARRNCILSLFAARPNYSETGQMRFASDWSISPIRRSI